MFTHLILFIYREKQKEKWEVGDVANGQVDNVSYTMPCGVYLPVPLSKFWIQIVVGIDFTFRVFLAEKKQQKNLQAKPLYTLWSTAFLSLVIYYWNSVTVEIEIFQFRLTNLNWKQIDLYF